MTALTTRVHHDLVADVTVVTVAGLLDLAGATRTRAVLLKCLTECPAAIIADIRGVVPASPSLLTVFVAVARRTELLPDVAFLVCADPARLNPKNSTALASLPLHATPAAAMTFVQNARALVMRRELRLPAEARSAMTARRMIGRACDDWGVAHVRHQATMIVSELVANAVRHANSPVAVEVCLRGVFLHIRVHDLSTVAPAMRPEGLDADPRLSGRGLPLVDLYSSGWGAVIGEHGKAVWATIRTRPVTGAIRPVALS